MEMKRALGKARGTEATVGQEPGEALAHGLELVLQQPGFELRDVVVQDQEGLAFVGGEPESREFPWAFAPMIVDIPLLADAARCARSAAPETRL